MGIWIASTIMASNSDDKKFTVLFDTSKKEMLNPN